MSISFAPELGEAVREAAAEAGVTLSEWLAEAAAAKLRSDGDEEAELKRRMKRLDEYLDGYEAEHGAFTDQELAAAAREMGLPWPPRGEQE
jgi:hypothetical protein